MTKYLIVITFCVIVDGLLSAQKEDHQWMYNFGSSGDTINFPEFAASVIDFNTLPPQVYKDNKINLDLKECHASICDENGKLMLVSNGQAIYSKGIRPILNGDTINYGNNWEGFYREYPPGTFETTGFRVPQKIGFIPQPNTDTLLAVYQNSDIFFQDTDNNYIHLWYAKLVRGEDKSYSVVEKDILLNDRIYSAGKMVACKHGNGRDWWILQFNRDTAYTYLIEPTGIRIRGTSILPITVVKNTHGQSKFSPDGSKFAYFGVRQNNRIDGAQIMVSDFNRCTGRLYNTQATIVDSYENLLSSGLEFSPNSKFLYLSSFYQIRQMDLTSPDIFDSMEIVAEHNDINNCSVDIGTNPKSFGQMQLAPDNKIYISLGSQCNDVHIIHEPNERGTACNMEQNAIILPSFVFGTIPTLNTYRLGPIDGSACDTIGIDNNPVSRFWYEQDSLDFLSAQFWDVSYFRPENWEWTFGDGNNSSDRHPVHSYDEKGIYNVCLTVSNENNKHTSCQTLYLGVSSTENIENEIGVSIFPNPTEGRTRLVLSDYLPVDASLHIYNVNGQMVSRNKILGGANILDLSELELGTFFYELRDEGKVIKSGRIIRV